MTNKYGYSKISKIIPQTIMEPDFSYEDKNGVVQVVEKPVFEIVWIEAEGSVFSVVTERGETLDGLASRYKVGGYTDDRCCFFKTAGGDA